MITRIAVVGSGYMGGGIAQVFALAGREVRIADVSAEQAAHSRERIIAEAADYAGRGLFPEDAAERIAAGVSAAASIEEAVQDADFIEERMIVVAVHDDADAAGDGEFTGDDPLARGGDIIAAGSGDIAH